MGFIVKLIVETKIATYSGSQNRVGRCASATSTTMLVFRGENLSDVSDLCRA